MATTLTRDTIITYAGRMVGNEVVDVTTLRDWLNNIIDTLGKEYRWPELQKTATGTLAKYVTGQAAPEVALPADFGDLWDVHSLAVIDANGNHTVLTPQSWDWFDLITAPTQSTGTPFAAAFNLNTLVWTPYPMPQTSYTWQLRYRIKPSRLSSNATINFANDDIFIHALYVRLLQLEDDDRYIAEKAVLDQMIARYLGAYNKSPIKNRNIRFNANAFRTPANFR